MREALGGGVPPSGAPSKRLGAGVPRLVPVETTGPPWAALAPMSLRHEHGESSEPITRAYADYSISWHDHRKPCVSRHAAHQLQEPGQGHLILAVARQRLVDQLHRAERKPWFSLRPQPSPLSPSRYISL